MAQQMILAKQKINKSLGRWEYNMKSDTILLNNSAANIYYNEWSEKKVCVEDFFRILSARSSQHLSKVLTDKKNTENIFLQQVCCMDGRIKKVLVIVLNNENIAENRYGLSVDVTKIL